MALALLAGAFVLIPSESDADPEITRDYGQFYSYTLQFVFDGAEAQTIDWDFGDGSEHSTEWNPRHVYAEKGTYYVTQTTTNTQGMTTEVYKVQIMGFPRITFDSNGGSSVPEIQMDSYNTTATKPADPTRSGYEFDVSDLHSNKTVYVSDIDLKGATLVDSDHKVLLRITKGRSES